MSFMLSLSVEQNRISTRINMAVICDKKHLRTLNAMYSFQKIYACLQNHTLLLMDNKKNSSNILVMCTYARPILLLQCNNKNNNTTK